MVIIIIDDSFSNLQILFHSKPIPQMWLYYTIKSLKKQEKNHIRKLINEIQFLNVYVVKDDYEKIIYSYEPPKYATPRVTIQESGWIELVK